MGEWAKKTFDYEKFDDIAFIITGQHSEDFEKKILELFDRVVHKKENYYHTYFCQKNKKIYPVVFNVYGASAIIDLIPALMDGGSTTLILVGYANGGLKNLEIGRIIIPESSAHFDGVYSFLKPGRKEGIPDKELKLLIQHLLMEDHIYYVNGINISVPANTLQPPATVYSSLHPSTLELELSSFLTRSKELNLRAAGILIIEENKMNPIPENLKEKMKMDNKLRVLKTLIKNIHYLTLPPHKKQESLSTYFYKP